MASGQIVLLWFIGSGIACILALIWSVIASLGLEKMRKQALALLSLTGALAVLPMGLAKLQRLYQFPMSLSLFTGATLCLLSAVVVLWKLRHDPALRLSANLGIAASLNLWLSICVLLAPTPLL